MRILYKTSLQLEGLNILHCNSTGLCSVVVVVVVVAAVAVGRDDEK